MKLTWPGAAVVMLSVTAFPTWAVAAQDALAVPGQQSGHSLQEVADRPFEDLRGPRSGDALPLQLVQAGGGRPGCTYNDEVVGAPAWYCPEPPREQQREIEQLREEIARQQEEIAQKQEELRARMRAQREEIARQQEENRARMRAQREADARQQQEAPPDLISAQASTATEAWMERNGIASTGSAERTLALMVQTALALQKFDPGPRDGVLGPKTIAALLAWQAMAGWAATGDLAGTLNAVLRTALVLQGYDPDPDNPLFGQGADKIMDAWGSQHGSALGTPDRDRQLWGAFAYSRTRDGWSAGSISGRAHRAIAVRAALDSCRKSKWGDNCKEILAFSDGCGALAVGKARGYGVATGRTRSQAERNALAECRRVSTNCQVRKKLTTCNPAADRFQSQALSDFQVTVPAGQRDVELCVRDHECEDGDRISVSVNGAQVFSGELYNSWSCHTVPVKPGSNPISMFAINGTGFKGACSHADGNTGEMRVTGTNSATQSWRHRGGAGSSAQITVQVQ